MNKLHVRTLIGHKQVSVGLICLSSLLNRSDEQLHLTIHDDGTLTDEDQDRLREALPGSVLTKRVQADEQVEILVQKYPNCSAYRRKHPLALKLIDMALLEPVELAYCDSDILFLKRFSRLYEWPSSDASAIFMQDRQEAYSLRPWHLSPLGRIGIPRRINSGLILFRTPRYDLDFVEWFLGRPAHQEVFKKRPHWIEQTCWAALGWRAGCRVWSSDQLMIANPDMSGLSSQTVGIHFVAAYRRKLEGFLNHECAEEPAVAIRTDEARPASLIGMVLDDIKRRF